MPINTAPRPAILTQQIEADAVALLVIDALQALLQPLQVPRGNVTFKYRTLDPLAAIVQQTACNLGAPFCCPVYHS